MTGLSIQLAGAGLAFIAAQAIPGDGLTSELLRYGMAGVTIAILLVIIRTLWGRLEKHEEQRNVMFKERAEIDRTLAHSINENTSATKSLGEKFDRFEFRSRGTGQ